MKIAFMGAGAVGCYFGALLAQAKHEVMLIGRPTHVDAVRKQGLLLEKQGTRSFIPMSASTEASAVSGADIVIVCVKSQDTENAGREMGEHLAADCAILSFQNGVDNAERLQSQLGRTVTPSVVYVAAEMAGPGHVQHHGSGRLSIGPSPKSAEIAAAFTAAAIPTEISPHVIGALWEKLILNCCYNALSAITQQPYGQMAQSPGIWPVMQDIVQECETIARRLGVTIAGDVWAAVKNLPEIMPTQRSSTAQDLARGRSTEIDYLNGFIVRKGEELGISTPVNRALHRLVKLLEANREGR